MFRLTFGGVSVSVHVQREANGIIVAEKGVRILGKKKVEVLQHG